MKSVLDVGNCGFDHGAIKRLIETNFEAVVEQVHDAATALSKLRSSRYDLILVNRVFDRDRSDGLELIERITSDDELASLPVMLITNFAEHQQSAANLGAVPGFGKASLHATETKQRLAAYLA